MIETIYSSLDLAWSFPSNLQLSVFSKVTSYVWTIALVVILILMFPVILAAGIVNCVLSSLRLKSAGSSLLPPIVISILSNS